MDPLQSAENADMPKQTAKTIDLSPEQRATLFGEGPLEPGKPYTITLTAGDMADSGFQTFEVGSKAEGAIETEVEDEEASDESTGTLPPPAEEPESNEAEISALGYDRSKLMKKKPAPKMDARSLEFD
jgi:hypothetical protein